jgi:uncharacterized protein YutD
LSSEKQVRWFEDILENIARIERFTAGLEDYDDSLPDWSFAQVRNKHLIEDRVNCHRNP